MLQVMSLNMVLQETLPGLGGEWDWAAGRV
jgi:hypothetical protein